MQNPDTGLMEMITPERAIEIKKEGKYAVFRVGEIVDLHGGRFRVRKITKKDIILRGIPMNEKE
jgi:hypothetical protein